MGAQEHVIYVHKSESRPYSEFRDVKPLNRLATATGGSGSNRQGLWRQPLALWRHIALLRREVTQFGGVLAKKNFIFDAYLIIFYRGYPHLKSFLTLKS